MIFLTTGRQGSLSPCKSLLHLGSCCFLTRALFVFMMLCSLPGVHGQQVRISGDWFLYLDHTHVISEPGDPIVILAESPVDQVDMDIVAAGNRSWKIDVRRSDLLWHEDLELSVRKTSDGSGVGSIAGGSHYLPLCDYDQLFLQGDHNRHAVYLQLKLECRSSDVEAGTYSTSVIYTITNQ